MQSNGSSEKSTPPSLRWVGVGLTLLVTAMLAGVAPSIAAVGFSEIHYHPQSDTRADEFIELVNDGGAAVDLSNWCVDGIAFCFPAASSIDPGERLILAADTSQFFTTYALTADFEYPLGELDDGGERLALLDAGLAVIDQVLFEDEAPWPVTPDGLGPSLEKIVEALPGNDPRNWRASSVADGTPGAPNSVASASLPPWIDTVQHTASPAPATPIVVTARVLDSASVQLTYRIGFGTDVMLPMLDDGASGDGAAADGIFGASIPGQSAETLVRYRIDATGATGVAAYPRADDTVQFDGTVVEDSSIVTQLPIFRWFVEPSVYAAALDHRLTDDTELAVLAYGGKIYDGVLFRVRGQSSRQWPKPPWKFFMPQGHNFEAPDILDRSVDTFNLQSSYADKTYLREILAWESFREAGSPYNQIGLVRVQQNAGFFGLFNLMEASDLDWVRRNRLSTDAARYKAFSDGSPTPTPADLEPLYDKETRLDEDYTDLHDFLVPLNTLTGQPLREFLLDNVDIPTALNYIAVQTVLHNNDHVAKNYFFYRDSIGSGRWTFLPWDLDLTFGRNFIGGNSLNDEIWADDDAIPGFPVIVSPSHPLFGTNQRTKVNGIYNRLIDRLFAQPDIQSMYLRRLRTLMDRLLTEGIYESRIDELVARIQTEADLDVISWGQYGTPQTLSEAVTILKDDYLDRRRQHLFGFHSVCDIPDSPTGEGRVVLNEVMYNPITGIDDEFIELYNPSPLESVDISGWRLEGVSLTVPPGTVLLPQSYLLFVKNDVAFRTTHGGGKFIAGTYAGNLNDLGESLVLTNRYGGFVAGVTFESVAPWPLAAAGAGSSLELIDANQATGKVVNWAASLATGGTPGAPNSRAGTIQPVPDLFINEVLPVNASINQDGAGDFDPWIEIYNGSAASIDLGGMTLTDDLGNPTLWTVPAGNVVCSGCWLLIWADQETGEGDDHANFLLNPAGGTVALFAAAGQMIDYLNYPALPADNAFGRFPDGSADLRSLSLVTPQLPNDAPKAPLILNEYNAVRDDRNLANQGSDPYWGRVEGNGGDWFELVVTGDHVDLRGWQLATTDDTGGLGETSQTLTFSTDPVWSDLRSGTVVTVSEQLPDDISYDPQAGDWWINVRAAAVGTGAYITAADFEVSNANWQLEIRNASAVSQFGPAGEGIWPLSGIGSDEVFKLEEDPSPFLTVFANYNDGSSSTFGLPNRYAAGSLEQDFSALRQQGLDGSCLGTDTDTDSICDEDDNCPALINTDQADADADGMGDLCDPCPMDALNDIDVDGLCADVDNCPLIANVGQADGDTDGVGDICDNCSIQSNPSQADDDNDNLGDACDPCLGDALNDLDSDGVCSSIDNCPDIVNAGQENADGDAFGDACDGCPNDPDNDVDLDGVCGDIDTCPTLVNIAQTDTDTDGFGDPCDNCPSLINPPQLDNDLDGLGDACDPDDDQDGIEDDGDSSGTPGDNPCSGGNTVSCDDNCPFTHNPDQADQDSNGFGDACDSDDDGDGLDDPVDNCPLISNVAQTDADSDGFGDECDCAPANPSLASAPGHVPNSLRISSGGGFSWLKAPQGHASNLYRGTFTNPSAWSYDEVCIESQNPGTTTLDAATPGPGIGFYYLIAGVNQCAEGPAGRSSAGVDVIPAVSCNIGPADFDSDGVDDLLDNCAVISNPTQADGDTDFVGDLCDNCPVDSNFDQLDFDGDTLGDACDPDDDEDGIADASDNCPFAANPLQGDADADGIGDACDPCTDLDGDGLGDPGFPANICSLDLFPTDPNNDVDRDSVSGELDNCPLFTNSDQLDADADGLGDACDICPFDSDNDMDGDGVCAGDCGVIDVDLLQTASFSSSNLIEQGTTTRYLANLTDPTIGLTWIDPAYDDAGWTEGIFGLGYETSIGAANLIATAVPDGTYSIYTRTPIQIPNPQTVQGLFLGLDYDDGVVVWINGVEVYRSPSMPPSAPVWNTTPAAHESSNAAFPNYNNLIDVSALGVPTLVVGENIVAIGVWNRNLPGISSDLVLVPRLSLDRDSTMRYLANSVDPLLGLGWTAEAFDDSSWLEGAYGVGYEISPPGASGLINSPVPFATNSVYTRALFDIPDVTLIERLILGADYDDGFVAWINGTEVFRSAEMPAGDPEWDTVSTLHESSNSISPVFELFDISAIGVPLLHSGFNTLAIGVWNESPGSSDLALVPALSSNGLGVDNCPTVANADQLDSDSDSLGDACDNCVDDPNLDQRDTDGDGLGDVCDPS